jgi:purine nucleoside phosphorylase
MAKAEIGVFGGSGFYSFLEDVEQVEVETPYGTPSAPFMIGEIGGTSAGFCRATASTTSFVRTRSRTGRTSGR